MQLILMVFLLLFVYKDNFSEALNCRPFSPQEASFIAKIIHQIELDKDGEEQSSQEKSHIVYDFVASVNRYIKLNRQAIDPKGTIEKNARKMITIATDMCYRLPSKNHLPAYINCVQYLLYVHMQKLVMRLESKWVIDFENKAKKEEQMEEENLLQIYADKKMKAFNKMVEGYKPKEMAHLKKLNEKISRKFNFCLEIEGETQFECKPISVENAQLFLKYFRTIEYETEFERKRSKRAELLAIHIFNALRAERRSDEQSQNMWTNVDEEKQEKAKIVAKNWKLAEPSMRVRVQVLVNTAERKCRELDKKHLFNCIYYYMYAFGEKLIRKIEIERGNDHDTREIKKIYMEKRRKMQSKGMENIDKLLMLNGNDEKATTLSSKDGEGNEEENEEEEEEEDVFRNCANVVEDYVDEEPILSAEYDGRTFDEHLFECASQFFEAVAKKQFDYKLIVNPYTVQLDIKMEFPESMKAGNKTPTNSEQKVKDKCIMMRELLLSLNRSLAHRLSFQKITSRNEKEDLDSLNNKYKNLNLERMDKNWLQRMGKKISEAYDAFRLTNSFATLTHPIRDIYRQTVGHGFETFGQTMLDVGQKAIEYGQKAKEYGQEVTKEAIQKLKCGSPTSNSNSPTRTSKSAKIDESDRTKSKKDVDSRSKTKPKTLHDLIKKEEDAAKSRDKIEEKMKKIKEKINARPLYNRLEVYKKFFRAFYIALAIELFEKMENYEKTTEKDKKNVEKEIKDKKEMEIFDEIVQRMGKKMGENATGEAPTQTAPPPNNANEAEDKRIGIGYELRFLGYVTESDGAELLEAVKSEMELNLDQFNMSFDAQCDMTNDLSDCFAASDGLDYDAQIGMGSFVGKPTEQMGVLQRTAENYFKTLTRWSYKFGRKEMQHNNFMKRFFTRFIGKIVTVLPKLMTDEVAPCELFVPFYRSVKQLVVAGVKNAVVKPSKRMIKRIVVHSSKKKENLKKLLALFTCSCANSAMHDDITEDGELKNAEEESEVQNMEETELSEINPEIQPPPAAAEVADHQLDDQFKQILDDLSNPKTDDDQNSKIKANASKKLLMKFEKPVGMIKKLIVAIALKKFRETKKSKRSKRGIMDTFIEAEGTGGVFFESLETVLIDAKLTETVLTTPLPGVHLYWIHFNHAVMVGPYNLAMTFVTGLIMLFVLISFVVLWKIMMLAVKLSIDHGECLGWTFLIFGIVLFIIFFWVLFIGPI